MKYEDRSHWDRHDPDTWVEHHILYLTAEERDRVFLTASEASRCWRRNGGEWKRVDGSTVILKPEVDAWVRARAGHNIREVWDADRYFYPGEELPDLPRGARAEWLRAGRIAYGIDDWGWQVGDAYIMFKDKEAATLFAMFWL